MTTEIYGLFDPVTAEVRYVGRTVMGTRKRLNHHVSGTVHAATPVGEWLRGLGCRPEIDVLEIVPDESAHVAELFWIEYMRFIGCVLLNAANPRARGRRWTQRPETVALRVAKLRNPTSATKERLRRAKLGNTYGSGNRGRVVPVEQRERIAQALRGRPLSEEHRQRIADGNRRAWRDGRRTA